MGGGKLKVFSSTRAYIEGRERNFSKSHGLYVGGEL